MTQVKKATTFYTRGTNNPQLAYLVEGNYPIVQPQRQSYYGLLLTGVISNNINKTKYINNLRQMKFKN